MKISNVLRAAKAQPKAPKKGGIPTNEQKWFAMMFTVSNLGYEHLLHNVAKKEDIKRAYDQVHMDHESEGIDIIDEYNDWVKESRKSGNKYYVTEWTKFKNLHKLTESDF